ncbi:MAG: leucyl/phenylalanyl-tRNA--protein transferase [Pseudomonadales bacterium]
MKQIKWLDADSLEFPPLDEALAEPDGLLAAGGDLSPERLLLAYKSGIFPWYEEGQPILWWSPDPRAIVFPQNVRITRSLNRTLRSGEFEIRIDTRFEEVLNHCSEPRAYTDGTWITDEMKTAYNHLFQLGYAHSVETFVRDELVGGLYGVGIGSIFFGESMFHHQTDASKVAFAWLCRLLQQERCPLIDCQVGNAHLTSLGAIHIPRKRFETYIARYCAHNAHQIAWDALPSRIGAW